MTRLLRATPYLIALTFFSLGTGLVVAEDAKTPLSKWMKPNMGVPFASADYATVQQSLTLVASKPAPSGAYGQWSSIATAGATACHG
jgi:hypothetical protein